ncbi:hypothetical protein BaRGS_00003764, partial [Batillaria attramentaria]
RGSRLCQQRCGDAQQSPPEDSRDEYGRLMLPAAGPPRIKSSHLKVTAEDTHSGWRIESRRPFESSPESSGQKASLRRSCLFMRGIKLVLAY